VSRSPAVKGMVSWGDATYRIERIAPATYAIVRISDDVRVGTFRTGKTIETKAQGIDQSLFDKLARAAVQTAKTSWVKHPNPSPPKAREREEPVKEEGPASSVRRFVIA
jgi:hypothetical protein